MITGSLTDRCIQVSVRLFIYSTFCVHFVICGTEIHVSIVGFG